jgi:UDP-N-acetylmuramoylalanine--D-glutamate ligase
VEFRGKKILIFGLGRSGVGAANLLSDSGADVTVTDRKPEGELKEYVQQLSPPVKLCLGGYPERMNGTDLVVVSPGVPLEIGPLAKAREKGLKIIGELELAYEMTRGGHSPDACTIPFLAVTGSNGKSTTTMLLDMMLGKGGFRTLLGGNIGRALTEEIRQDAKRKAETPGSEGRSTAGPKDSSPDFAVVEVSSFQLESISEFKPAGAAILNITPDHLDRYHSMDEYREAKAAIFRNQDEKDYLVLNADDAEVRRIEHETLQMKSRKPRVFFFSRREEVKGIYLKGGRLFYHFPGLEAGDRTSELIRADEIRIKGVHNLENAMAASAMALLAGCPPDAVAAALREFPGLEHRLEFVREIEGVRYINDSKGTNVGAVMKSIEGFREPVILIAGGRDKAGEFGQLRGLVRERVKTLILIGEAAEKMKSALGDLTETVIASDLRDAVKRARELSRKGDVVLLSPACASFDMFRDFEDRGRQFKDLVRGLS